MFLSSNSVLIYKIVSKPMTTPSANYIEWFNEFTIVTLCYCLIDFSDAETNSDFKYKVGWFACGAMVLNFLVNLTMLLGT